MSSPTAKNMNVPDYSKVDEVNDVDGDCVVSITQGRGEVRRMWCPLYITATVAMLIGIVLLIVLCFIGQIPNWYFGSGGKVWSAGLQSLCTNGCGVVDDALIADVYAQVPGGDNDTIYGKMVRLSSPFVAGECEVANPNIRYTLRPDSTHPKAHGTLIFDVSCLDKYADYYYNVNYSASLTGYRLRGSQSAVKGEKMDRMISIFVPHFMGFLFGIFGLTFLLQCGAMFLAARNPPAVKTSSVKLCCDCDPAGCCDSTCANCSFEGCGCCVCTPSGHMHRLMGPIIAFQVLGLVVVITYMGFCGAGIVYGLAGEREGTSFTVTGGYWALLSVILVVELVALSVVCAIHALKLF